MIIDLSYEEEYALENIRAMRELTALKDEYESLFGERPKFDPLRHRTGPVFIKEITDRIEEYKNQDVRLNRIA